jgi:hypothetical protein
MKRSPRKRHFTITEAARELGIRRQSIHEAIRKGRLEAERGYVEVVRTVKTNMRAWRIPAKSLDAYRVSLLHQELGKKTD